MIDAENAGAAGAQKHDDLMKAKSVFEYIFLIGGSEEAKSESCENWMANEEKNNKAVMRLVGTFVQNESFWKREL